MIGPILDAVLDVLRPLGDIGVMGATFMTFMAVFFLALGILDAVRRRQDIRRRALLQQGFGEAALIPSQEWLETTKSLRFESIAATSAILGDVERQVSEKGTEASKIKRDLALAGYFGPNALLWYLSTRYFLLVSFAFLSLLVVNLLFSSLSTNVKLLSVASSAAIGFLLPSRFVAVRQRQVVEECRGAFPDFIDLLVICVEAGLSPRAAIDRIAKEIVETYAYFGANLYLSNLELKAGAPLSDTLFNLARRTKVEEAQRLASVLEQTEQLGTSVTDALRIYSEEMRDRRLIEAEEKASALPVKLVLPLGIYVFPVMLVVILLPVIVRMKNAFLAN